MHLIHSISKLISSITEDWYESIVYIKITPQYERI